MFVLLLPKLMGLVARSVHGRAARAAAAAPLRLVASFFAELVVSALLAPIMMVIHSRQIYEILAGRDAGWSPQRRDDGETRWRDAWRLPSLAHGLRRRHRRRRLVPLAGDPRLALADARRPASSPCRCRALSGSARVGALLRRAGLLVTPEETRPDPLFAAAR